MQNYEIRKHYEAAINDLANLYFIDTRSLRGEIKNFLIAQKIIVKSTTELNDEAFMKLADQVSIFHARMSNKPPAERGTLSVKSFESIIKIDPKNNTKTNAVHIQTKGRKL